MPSPHAAKHPGPAAPAIAAVAASLLLAVTAAPALAGEFSVSPVRADFAGGARSASITVNNEHATDPLNVQAQPMVWTQDASGKDVYTPTEEISYFPRLATIESQNSRVFRIGVKGETPAVEKAYRFFIEEVPKAQGDATKTQITVTVRFGAPVFQHPAKVAMGGEITSLAVKGDSLEVGIHNTGNMHFMVEQAVARYGAAEPVSEHGWYLLPGASRIQTLKLPAGSCDKIDPKTVSVKIVTEIPEFSIQSGATNVTRDCTAKPS